MTTRRRFLTILAGATILPSLSSAAPSNWQGIALGADARIILDHPDADNLIALAVAEIDRLENLFSLHRDSQLTQLNRNGNLPNPAPEMLELLSLCSAINARTNGAFDPTIQPLWALYAQHYANGASISEALIANAPIGWQHVRFSPTEVSFAQPGMQLTLNGIAQGYIADRVAALFRANNVQNVLINTGEIMALGTDSSSNAWPVQITGGQTVPMQNAAIATSALLGTTFDQGATISHIIDPRTRRPGGLHPQISVIAGSAALADGLSTAFCLMSRDEIDAARGDAMLI